MASNSDKRRGPARIKLPLWALAVLAGVFLVVVIASSAWLFNTVRSLASAGPNEIAEFNPTEVDSERQPVASELDPAADEGEPLPIIVPEELEPWSGSERINILFLGTDQRCDEVGPTHSDTLMLATIDPETMSATLFSLLFEYPTCCGGCLPWDR